MIKKIFLNEQLRSQVILTLFSNASSAINFCINIILIRELSASEIGAYSAIMAIPPIIFAFLAFVPYVVSQEVIENNDYKSNTELGRIYFGQLYLNIFFSLVLAASAIFISRFLKIENPMYIIVLSLIMFLNGLMNFYVGILQGLHNFFLIGLKDLLYSFMKVVLILVLLRFTKSAWVIVTAELFSVAALTLVLKTKLRDKVSLVNHGLTSFKEKINSAFAFFKDSSIFTFCLMLVGLITSFDILFVKSLMTPEQSGQYIAISNIARIVLFVGGASNLVIFLFTSKKIKLNDKSGAVSGLWNSIIMNLMLCFTVGAVIYFFKETLIQKLFLNKFADSTNLLLPMILYMSGLSVALNILNYFLAFKIKFPFLGLVLLYSVFFTICYFSPDSDMILLASRLIQLMSLVLIYLVFTLFFLKIRNSNSQ